VKKGGNTDHEKCVPFCGISILTRHESGLHGCDALQGRDRFRKGGGKYRRLGKAKAKLQAVKAKTSQEKTVSRFEEPLGKTRKSLHA